MSTAPIFRVEAVELFERPVKLRMPFRFGVVTLTAAPQAFVRARIRLDDGRQAEGMAAELMAPKWFDKNPGLSNEDNFEQLRTALRIARGLYTDGGVDSAFGHFARHYRAQIGRGAQQGLNSLVANYGPALVDRAVLDALCRALQLPFHEVIRRNQAGIQVTPLTPDLAGFDLDAFLAGLQPPERIAARHTVGLVDPITADDAHDAVGDGLPETLEEVVSTYGHRWFKLKVAGNVDADVARLLRIAQVLDRIDAFKAYGTTDVPDAWGFYDLPVVYGQYQNEPQLNLLEGDVTVVSQVYSVQDKMLVATIKTTVKNVDTSENAIASVAEAVADRMRTDGLTK